jgi:hypothetical protein
MTCPTFLAQPGVQNGMIMWNQPRVSVRPRRIAREFNPDCSEKH